MELNSKTYILFLQRTILLVEVHLQVGDYFINLFQFIFWATRHEFGESANCPYGKKSIWRIIPWENVCIGSIHLQNNCYYSFSEGTCTKDHPFAYKNGQYCCETNQELVNGGNSDEVASGTCDGIGFSIESTCCKDHKYLKCPHTKCKDYGGKDYEKFDTVSKILKTQD